MVKAVVAGGGQRNRSNRPVHAGLFGVGVELRDPVKNLLRLIFEVGILADMPMSY